MQNFINVANDDGSGYVISVVESEATSNANASKVAELWGTFSDHMEAAPKAAGYDVVANWSNRTKTVLAHCCVVHDASNEAS